MILLVRSEITIDSHNIFIKLWHPAQALGLYTCATDQSRSSYFSSFNFMLIGLSFFDTWYLFGSILESFRIAFDLETNLHIQLFPYFLYPGQMIVMMCSVYMTVAIAIERFSAVRYPLIYNQVSTSRENVL